MNTGLSSVSVSQTNIVVTGETVNLGSLHCIGMMDQSTSVTSAPMLSREKLGGSYTALREDDYTYNLHQIKVNKNKLSIKKS